MSSGEGASEPVPPLAPSPNDLPVAPAVLENAHAVSGPGSSSPVVHGFVAPRVVPPVFNMTRIATLDRATAVPRPDLVVPALAPAKARGRRKEPRRGPARPEPSAERKPRRRIAEIRGVWLVRGRRVGVVLFTDSEKPEVVPWDDLRRQHTCDVITFYERHIVRRPVTADELEAARGGVPR